MIGTSLKRDGISRKFVLNLMDQTAQSVILYDKSGRRQIHVDLKDVQDRAYPHNIFNEALKQCSMAVLCNLNCARPFLNTAKEKGKIIATDVHVISDIHDSYNMDFMCHADILFMSNEGIKGQEEEFAKRVIKEYDNEILVIGLGRKGIRGVIYKSRTSVIKLIMQNSACNVRKFKIVSDKVDIEGRDIDGLAGENERCIKLYRG